MSLDTGEWLNFGGLGLTLGANAQLGKTIILETAVDRYAPLAGSCEY